MEMAWGACLLQIPERRIRFHQFESGVPGLMAAPDHLSFGFAARLRMDQADAFVQWQVRSHHRHTARVAYVYGDSVGVLFRATLLPLHQELHARNDALVASQSFPSFL